MSASKALGMSAGKAARRVGVAALAVLAALLVVSCEDDGGEGAIEVDLPAKTLSVVVNPKTGTLLAQTGVGVYELPTKGGSSARRLRAEMVFGSTRVPISRVLTFSYASRDTLLGSSHPDTPESGAPANLGLLVSRDGRTWLPRSLLGTADLHLIRPAEGTLYARDYAVPRLLITSNFGRNWTARKLPGEVIDLAVDPQKPSHAFAVTDRALLVTEDLARSWRPAGEATAVVWPTHGPLYVAGADGSVRASEKGEDEGDIRGVLDSPATELSAGRRGELWALSDDRVLRISRDGGRTWNARYRLREKDR